MSNDKVTAAALDALPDKKVSAGIEKLLMNGSEFKEMWTIEQPAGDDFVYISVLKFEQLGFLQDYQFAQATLALQGQTDPLYEVAYEAISNEFDSTFYPICLKDKVDPEEVQAEHLEDILI